MGIGNDFVVIANRGGHLHNALSLMDQLRVQPKAIITTTGPELESIRQARKIAVYRIPVIFTWIGKQRFLNPLRIPLQFLPSFLLTLRLRPQAVISLGASDVIFFCYFARLLGAKIYHVECLNQVQNPSITGRMLYPIATEIFVQWKELLPKYGPKARYAGWVI